MNRIIFFLLLSLSLPLHSLEIRLNGTLYDNFSEENLQDLSYRLPDSPYMGIFLYELLPLMEEIHSFRFVSRNFLMETDPEDSLVISKEEDLYYIKSNSIGKIPLPDVIEISGVQARSDQLIIWFDEEDPLLIREIDLFARLHQLKVVYRVEKNITSLLEYNIFNETIVPDLIIFNDKKLNSLYPLIIELPDRFRKIPGQSSVSPLKFSRQIYLNGASGGENNYLTSDFGDLNLMYPLFLRFGLEEEFSIDQLSIRESFFYLTGLGKQGRYRLSGNPHNDFISGKMDSIYSSSTIFSEMGSEPAIGKNRSLPNMGGENPPPLLNYKLLAVPTGYKDRVLSHSLIRYLTAFGVQQRVDPRTGYLPYDKTVYSYLKDSSYKELLLENLDNARWLAPAEWVDKLRFLLPRIYRLIITERLSIDDGILEMAQYLEN